MKRVPANSLRLVCLCPLLLLLVGTALAQTATPTGTATPAATVTDSPTRTRTPTPSVTVPATVTRLPPTPLPTNTVRPAAPLPTQVATPPATVAPTGGGLLAGDGVVPLLLGGLLLLAGLAILSLLWLRRRRPARVAPSRASEAARAATVPPPISAEQVTSVLAAVYLELESNPSQRFPLRGTPFAIGRGPGNDLVIDETFPQWQTVSRQHALISHHERGYVIEDLGSQNGLRVNGRPTPKNLIRSGWQIAIGGVIFRFVDETQTN